MHDETLDTDDSGAIKSQVPSPSPSLLFIMYKIVYGEVHPDCFLIACGTGAKAVIFAHAFYLFIKGSLTFYKGPFTFEI